MTTIPYIGNGAYCYANSLAMLLEVAGAHHEPWHLEVLTTVGIGAFAARTPDGPLPFFSGIAPDRGLDVALRTLGFACERAYGDADGDAALARLRGLLGRGPALVGPLDMSKLTYIPGHERLTDADHFVLVHALSDTEALLHDPGGYPYVALGLPDFLAAWRAEAVAYRRGSFSLWAEPRRVAHPTPGEILVATDAQIAVTLREDGDGSATIHRLAAQVASGVPSYLHGHLTSFALPLGARRAADFARFYAAHDPERAAIKAAQARHFGAAFVALRRAAWGDLAAALRAVATAEERFAARTLAAVAVPTAVPTAR